VASSVSLSDREEFFISQWKGTRGAGPGDAVGQRVQNIEADSYFRGKDD
jgi:hypothetical protein